MFKRFIFLPVMFFSLGILLAETSVTLPSTPNITVVPTPLEGAGTQTITVEVKTVPAPAPKPQPQIRAVLIVQNHAVQSEYQRYMSAVADMLTGALSNLGLTIINPANAIGTTQNTTADGEVMPAAAATGLTGMLGADYFITASLRRITQKTTGLRPETSFTSLTMGMTLTIATGHDAAAFASQDVVLESPQQSARMMNNNLEDIFHNLLEDCSNRGAEWLMEKIAAKQSIPTGAAEMVSVAFSCNVPGAFLEIDGVAVGTVSGPVNLHIPAGLHNMRVSCPFFLPYELQAIFREGSRFYINLELSPEGFERWQSRELFLTLQKRIIDSGASDDHVRRVLADGKAESLKNSHFRWDGALQTLSIINEGQTPVVYGPVLQK